MIISIPFSEVARLCRESLARLDDTMQRHTRARDQLVACLIKQVNEKRAKRWFFPSDPLTAEQEHRLDIKFGHFVFPLNAVSDIKKILELATASSLHHELMYITPGDYDLISGR